MIEPIRHGLANLFKFKGRDPRSLFWPYAGFVFLLAFLVNAAVFLTVLGDTFGKMQRFAASHPELATVQRSATNYSISVHGQHPELEPSMSGLVGSVDALAATALLLLAAAVARRLHDCGKSALWGLLPVPFLLMGMAGSTVLFASFNSSSGPDLRLFSAIFMNNIIYIASLVTLIVMLAKKSTQRLNRFGELVSN